MSDKVKVIDVTLELILRTDVPEGDIEFILTAAMQGAVDAVPKRMLTGLGYNYSYTRKKSRRGMTITSKENKV